MLAAQYVKRIKTLRYRKGTLQNQQNGKSLYFYSNPYVVAFCSNISSYVTDGLRFLTFFVGVVFEDGTEVKDIHGIIFATGYKIGFPCLEEGLVPVEKNEVPLYKYVFPYEHKHHTMAILGCLQPIGAVMPLSELQARWAVKVFSGKRGLPSNDEMKMEMAEKKAAMARRYYKTERHTIQV